jgi:glycosyltransferase involved in cell wall biosynthesis
MTLPLISCIVPVLNGERYLKETLESILAQDYRPIDILVVDDGSIDGTPDVVRSFGSEVDYVRQANAGQAVARNRGVDMARGEFVAFLDADDLWHPEKLTRQMNQFVAQPDLGYCLTHVQNFWERELQDEAASFRGHPRGQPIPGFVTGTLLARRPLFERIGGFDISLGHADKTEWFMRADAAGARRELLPDVLMFRRMHPGNRSRTLASNSRDEYLHLLKASLDRRRGSEGL